MLTDHDMNCASGYVAEMIADGKKMGLRQGKYQSDGAGRPAAWGIQSRGTCLNARASPLAMDSLHAFLRHDAGLLGQTFRKGVILVHVREFGARGHIG
jgi:hypothetical protein